MRILDGGMVAFAAWHALKEKISWPLTFQVPRMLRRMLVDKSDTWIVCWNGERLWKRELWPAYRDRPEIWDEAGREDFHAMLDVLSALGMVQFRTLRLEADETLAALVHRFEGDEEIVILSDDTDTRMRMYGAPTGYEFVGLIEAIVVAGTGKIELEPETMKWIQSVDKPTHIQVFSTPT